MSLQSLLTAQGFTTPPARTNAKNDGRRFQEEMKASAAGYLAQGVARLEKVDPPVKIIWPIDKRTGVKTQRVIFMENPFVDYIGCFTTRAGQMLAIEAKSTSNHRLPFKRDGGLTETQWNAMKAWTQAGAVVGLVWQYNGNVRAFTLGMIEAWEEEGVKSLTHESGRIVLPGVAGVRWDFLACL